jgi:hypothetical protein
MRNKFMENALPMVSILLVCSCPVFALPPDRDNAALLYYQAFCIYEKPDDTMQDMIRELANGRIEPNPTITKYIESCRPAIKLAESAAELNKCDWGVTYSDGLDAQAAYLAQARNLTHIILADARIALKQADYDLAIQRCLTARKFGIDVGQDPLTVGFLVEKSIERISNRCIQDILSSGAMELKKVQHLKAQLDKLDRRIKPLEFFLKVEQEVMAMYMTPERIRQVLPLIDPKDDARKLILNADQEFCKRNLAYHTRFWDDVFPALELPYQRAYSKVKELEKKANEDYKENPDATMTILLSPATWNIYNNGIQSRTLSNAVKTALEIYEIAARTGQLPDSLPAGLPKDLFSNKDFEYEKTADGFILRCRGEDLVENKIHEYDFKVKK